MRVHLGFLSRKSSESTLSTRPLPEEARKWSECFTTLMTSKCNLLFLYYSKFESFYSSHFVYFLLHRWIVSLPGIFTSWIQQREPGILVGRWILQKHETKEDGSQSSTDLQRIYSCPSTQTSTYICHFDQISYKWINRITNWFSSFYKFTGQSGCRNEGHHFEQHPVDNSGWTCFWSCPEAYPAHDGTWFLSSFPPIRTLFGTRSKLFILLNFGVADERNGLDPIPPFIIIPLVISHHIDITTDLLANIPNWFPDSPL